MIVLTDKSALECLRNFSESLPLHSLESACNQPYGFNYVDLRGFSRSAVSTDDVDFILDWHSYLRKPIHLSVPRRDCRIKRNAIKCHCVSGHTLPESIVKLDGICVDSPEACFLKMAPQLSRVQGIRLGFELCGLYSMRNDGTGFTKHIPLTTPKKIEAFLENVGNAKGVKEARLSMRYVMPNSASPMETALAMMLCLSKRYGGYGLPRAQLNHRFQFEDEIGRIQTRFCDMMWPKNDLALEYDSDAFHSGKEQIAHDSSKRATLLAHGVDVISVTRTQVFSVRKLDEVATAIAKKLNHRLRGLDSAWRSRQFELRQELLYSDNHSS